MVQKKIAVQLQKKSAGEHNSWKKLTFKHKQDVLNSNIRSDGLVAVFILLAKTLIFSFQDIWLVR